MFSRFFRAQGSLHRLAEVFRGTFLTGFPQIMYSWIRKYGLLSDRLLKMPDHRRLHSEECLSHRTFKVHNRLKESVAVISVAGILKGVP